MQRKPTSNTRGPNAEEKRYQAWCKEQDCVWCGNPGPSIVDHCRGATFKHNKTLIGHLFCLPQCVKCDTQKTIHGKRLGNESEAWFKEIGTYMAETEGSVCSYAHRAIVDWGK